MKGTLIESVKLNSPRAETGFRRQTLLAVICAVLITALLFGGYAYLRKQHGQQTLATPQLSQADSSQAKGPAKAEIFVDEALLDGDRTIVAGTVRNTSNEDLTALSVDLELTLRKGGGTQKTSAPVEPAQLKPQQEGHYSLRLRSADYRSARLLALRRGSDSRPIASTTSPGKKRPPEKLETKAIIVTGPTTSKGGFLNTPDRPVRVP